MLRKTVLWKIVEVRENISVWEEILTGGKRGSSFMAQRHGYY